MAKFLGKNLRVAVEDSVTAGTYNDFGFATSDGVTYSYTPQTVPLSKDDTNLIPEILTGTGETVISASCEAIVETTNLADAARITAAATAGSLLGFEITSGIETISGDCVVTSIDITGQREGAQTMSFNVQFAAPPTVS